MSSKRFPDRNHFRIDRTARSEASAERTTESGFSDLPVVNRGDVEFARFTDIVRPYSNRPAAIVFESTGLANVH
jgi:hypothetical protein